MFNYLSSAWEIGDVPANSEAFVAIDLMSSWVPSGSIASALITSCAIALARRGTEPGEYFKWTATSVV